MTQSTAQTRARPQIIIHEDDVGMCHGANVAFQTLCDLQMCSAGSVMVPCPWFSEAAGMAVSDPRLDLGVHITLTSEKKYYRWRPMSTSSPASGLLDPQGYMWPSVPLLRQHAQVEAVEAEMRMQVETALQFGIDVTHLDAHQGAAIAPEFVDIFIRVAQDYGLPFLFPQDFSHYDIRHNLGEVDTALYDGLAAQLRETGQTTFDRVFETVWKNLDPVIHLKTYQDMFHTASGNTFMALHFNAPGDIDNIEPGSSSIRTKEFDLFRSHAFRDWVAQQPVDLIGFRQLRDRLRMVNQAQ